MHALQANLRPKFSQAVTARLNQGVPARYQLASNEQGFSSMVDKLNSESNIYSKIPLDQIETKMVKVKTVDAHGQPAAQPKRKAAPEDGAPDPEEAAPPVPRICIGLADRGRGPWS